MTDKIQSASEHGCLLRRFTLSVKRNLGVFKLNWSSSKTLASRCKRTKMILLKATYLCTHKIDPIFPSPLLTN